MAWKRTVHSGWTVALLVACLVMSSWAGLTEAQGRDAQARVVHAGAGIGPVDVYIDGDLAIKALDYGGATEYLDLPAGEYALQVTAAGGGPSEAVVDAVLVLDDGTPHTVVVIGPAHRADIVVLIDDHTIPPDGLSKLSLVNVTSDSVPVGLALQDGTALIEDVPFADASEYLELETGMYDIVILEAESGDEIASIPGFSAEPGTIYSVFALGADGEYQGVVFVDAVGVPSRSEPDPTPTEAAATATTTGAIAATSAETPTPAAIATAMPTATAAPMPVLPDTGDGGASKGGGFGTLVWLLAALLGGVIWRLGRVLAGGRS